MRKVEQNKDAVTRRLEASTTTYSFHVIAEGTTQIYNMEEGVINEDRIDGPSLHTYQEYDLLGIDLAIRKGTFFLLIGDKGSGKTSLLSALFGELKIDLVEKPTFYVQGKLFLMSESPWLMKGTLK